MNTIIERDIEQYLVGEVQRLGGVAEKVVSLNGRGFFDRIVVLPGGVVCFVEVKKPRGSRMSPHQFLRANTYRALGVDAVKVNTKTEVDALLTRLTSRA
jgi:hypothetical protein